MNETPFTFGAPGLLVLIAMFVVGWAVTRGRALRRELRRVEGFLEELRGNQGQSSPLARAVWTHVVGADPLSGKFVLSRPLPLLRREFVDELMSRHPAFWLGGMLTGLALICTFALIAHVMTGDVGDAIGESASAGSTGALHLSDAVVALGAKFYISAAGVLGSVAALVAATLVRASTCAVAEHPDLRLLAAFTSMESQQWSARLEHLELVRVDQAATATRHAETQALLRSLDTRIEKLHSIEVSVKTIGNEVSANLKNLMKDAMGEQLKSLLADTMVEVDAIAQRVRESLSETFGAQLGELATGMQQALEALQRSVEGQGQMQLEQILTQLQNTVSGGFQQESQRMMTVLESFASTVPALQQQMSSLTGKLAEESANLVGQVLGASRAEIEAISRQLQAAAEASASRHDSIDVKAAAAAAAVGQASEALASSAKSLIDSANLTSALIAQARAGSEASQAASRDFLAASSTLVEATGQVRAVMDATRLQTHEQQALLMRQREYTKEVEKLWPELFQTYLTQFKASADELGRSWESFHQKVSAASHSVGAEFAENTGILSEAVEQLVKLHADRRMAT